MWECARYVVNGGARDRLPHCGKGGSMRGEHFVGQLVAPLFEPLEARLLLDGLSEAQAVELFNLSPALFVENRGQWADPAVRFVHDGAGADIALTDSGPVFQVFREVAGEGAEQWPEDALEGPLAAEGLEAGAAEVEALRFSATFVGANPVSPVGLERSETVFNYFVGDEATWRQGVPAYEKVAYEGLYDGMDLYAWGRRSHLKYEFHVAPGADYRQIQVRYEGIEGLSLAEDGSLLVDLGQGWGQVIDDAPVIYQEVGGERVEVAGSFVLLDDSTYGFAISGDYRPDAELVIDPDLAWMTYLGGSSRDEGYGVAADSSGGAFVTGWTESSDFAGRTNGHHGGAHDAFVARVSSAGSVSWMTYLGGSGRDECYGVAADSSGAAFVAGWTQSLNFAGRTNGYHGNEDAFVARVSSAGSVSWMTYLGGSNDDWGLRVAADSSGGALVAGWTQSLNFAGRTNGYHGGRDAFVVRVSSAGVVSWMTYLGGSSRDEGYGVAADSSGGAFVGGYTFSSDFAGRTNGYHGGRDAFVARVSSAGSVSWMTYLGGSGWDGGYGVAADSSGGAFLTGRTESSDFDGRTNGHHGGDWDAFVARVSSVGVVSWMTYLGGSVWDEGVAVTADSSGGAFVAGWTSSSDFTGRTNGYHGGSYDAFVAKIGGGGAVNLPDLVVSESDLALAPEGAGQRVTATVHNRGSLDATGVAVRFRDPERGVTVGTETIASISAYDSETCSVLWTPAGPGARIEVTADPWNTIEEESELNNAAVAVYGAAGDPPLVTHVTAAWDGDGRSDVFGRFVSGVDLWDTFTASVLDPDGAADVDYVDFTLGPLGTETDDDPAGGWTADFNLGGLSGDTTLQVVAYDAAGLASDPWTGTVHVVPFPAWLGTPDGDDRWAGGHYHLNGFFPEELDVTHTMPADWWIVGGKESGFRLGVELGLTAGLSADVDVPVDHAFVFEAKVLDHELFGFGGDPFSFSVGDHVSVSFSGLADGETLAPTGLTGQLEIDDYTLYEGSVVGPSMTVIVPVAFVPVPLTVSAGVNFGLTVDGELNLGWDAADGELEVLGGSYFQPNVTAEPYLFGGVGVPGLNAGLEVGGELGLHYRGEYAGPAAYEDYLWGSFALNFRAVATAGAKFTLAEWTVPGPDDPQWVFGDPPPSGSMMLAAMETSGDGTSTVLPEPSVAADGAGNVLLTRVVDSDADPANVEADIFYATRDPGGTWTALSPVASETTIDSDPVVAFDGAGGAVASWVANATDPANVDPEAWDAYLAQQEIHSAYWNGTAWGPVQAVTADERMDGPPEIAFHNGQGLMVWEHATTVDSTDPDDYDIYYAVWDDATHTWGSPQALTSDAEGDWAPQVAFGPGGEAMAAWVHDDDGDATTADLHYATWDGAAWSAPAAVPLASTAGVREPRLVFDSDGDALLAWIGNEGAEDLLHVATWEAAGGSWGSSETVGGTPGFMEGLDLAISPTDTARLVWHGWDGRHDLFSTVCDLAGSGVWTPPARITDNADGEWMASTAFDAAGVPVTVWANEAVTTAFGKGAEGVELPLAPDLAVADVTVDAFQPVEGQEARLYAEVANDGWDGAEATTLTFYMGDPDGGGTAIGDPVDVGALAVGDATTVMSEIFALPAGTNEYYAVASAVTDEVDEANNTSATTLESLPPDLTGPQVVLELPEGGILREGTNTLALAFDEPVTWLGEPHISLVEATEGVMPPDHVYLSADGQSATLIFEGGLPETAANTYTFRLLDTVTDVAGNALDGDLDGIPGGDYQVAFAVATAPTLTNVRVNDRPGRGVGAIEPSGIGVRTIDLEFSEAVTFDAEDVTVQTVTFPGGVETVTGTLAPTLEQPAPQAMRITLGDPVGAVDTWVKVTLGAAAITDAAGNSLDGEPRLDSSGLGYIYDAEEDLPSGDGTAGGDAVFYVGSLQCDFRGFGPDAEEPNGTVDSWDINGFTSAYIAGEPDADFRGFGPDQEEPNGTVDSWDINGFTSRYIAAIAAGTHLDPLPTAGGSLAPGAPAPLPLVAAEAAWMAAPEVAASASTNEPGLTAASDELPPGETPPRPDSVAGAMRPRRQPTAMLSAPQPVAADDDPFGDPASAAWPEEGDTASRGESGIEAALPDLLALPALDVLSVS